MKDSPLHAEVRYAAALKGIFSFSDLSVALGYTKNRVSRILSGHGATIRARKRIQDYLGVHLWPDLPPPAPADADPFPASSKSDDAQNPLKR